MPLTKPEMKHKILKILEIYDKKIDSRDLLLLKIKRLLSKIFLRNE